MKYSICIGAYPGKDVVYHLEKVKQHGFHGLEFYAWWDLDLDQVVEAQERIGVGLSAICTHFISLVNESKRQEYIEGLKATITAAKKLGVTSIISQTGNVIEGLDRESQRQSMIKTLQECAPLCEEAGVVLELEPLNGLVDHQGHFLQYSDEAVQIIDAVGSEHVKLVFDYYHQQITEGNVIRNATQYKERINHYHIADNPGRKQPGTGELNYIRILQALQETGYDGYVGLECGYTVDTDQALSNFKAEIIDKLE